MEIFRLGESGQHWCRKVGVKMQAIVVDDKQREEIRVSLLLGAKGGLHSI